MAKRSTIVLALAAAGVLGLATLTGSLSAATAAQGSDGAGLRASLKTELEEYLSDRGVAEHISGVSLRVTFRGHKPSINIPVGASTYGGGEPLSKTNCGRSAATRRRSPR